MQPYDGHVVTKIGQRYGLGAIGTQGDILRPHMPAIRIVASGLMDSVVVK